VAGAGWLFDLPFDKAVAIENGRLTPFRDADSGRFLEIGARRAKALEAFICGERPAGFNADAGFEVEWETFVGVVGVRVVEVEVESTMI
jgi:hypothetical protein